jgi:hypothetical protein
LDPLHWACANAAAMSTGKTSKKANDNLVNVVNILIEDYSMASISHPMGVRPKALKVKIDGPVLLHRTYIRIFITFTLLEYQISGCISVRPIPLLPARRH